MSEETTEHLSLDTEALMRQQGGGRQSSMACFMAAAISTLPGQLDQLC